MNLTVLEVTQAIRGKKISGREDQAFTSVSIDSRHIEPGCLFVCIKGERFDGHDYIHDVLRLGARGIVVKKGRIKSQREKVLVDEAVIIEVHDTILALGDLACAYRKKFTIPFIAITGSNGKTTAKEFSSSVLSVTYTVLKNEGNKNNLIGVPLTLFKLNFSHEIAVIEMGMNQKGEIKRLCEIVCPQVGIVTNVSEAHIGNFKSIKEIKAEKQALIESLPVSGTAILNSDDPLVDEMRKKARCRVIGFGIKKQADVMAGLISSEASLQYRFTLQRKEQKVPVMMPISGYHNIYNALAAAAAGIEQDIALFDIKTGLEKLKNVPMRMEVIHIKQNVTIINDSYNANLASVLAALETLGQVSQNQMKIFLFGDMFELGKSSQKAHETVGKMVAKRGIDKFILLGKQAEMAGSEAINRGLQKSKVIFCKNREEAYDEVLPYMSNNCCLLVKGSRGMKLEHIVHKLVKNKE